MYPSEYLGLFPAFPMNNQIFVAMSFAPQFEHRWNNVIRPTIEKIRQNDAQMTAYRVDKRIVSDSILTEILTGISKSKMIIADITTIGYIDTAPVRNANVLYEVGIAQAVRLPEEVLLFRSDEDPILFDVTNIRINTYDPDGDVTGSQTIDLRKSLTVQRLAESLDYPSWWTLVTANSQGRLDHPIQNTYGQLVGSLPTSMAIDKLLQIRALRTRYTKLTPEAVEQKRASNGSDVFMRYECTPLGSAMLAYAADRMGLYEPAMVAYMKKNAGSGNNQPEKNTPNKSLEPTP
jgi:hypothetical protein